MIRRMGGWMRIIFTALALALLPVTHHLQAALGESQSQIAKRYGGTKFPPMAMTNRDLTVYFDYKDYTVGVTFLDGVCNRETFTRKDKKALNAGEIQYLLDANALGSKWVLMDDNKNATIWILDSKEAMAGYYKSAPYLSIQTPNMLAFDDAIKKLQEKGGPKQTLPPPPTDPNLRP